MIAKCVLIAFLAVAVRGDLLVRSGCNTQASPVAIVSSGCSSGSSGASSLTRNLVGQGRYPVALNNCGPNPSQQIPVTTSSVTAPVQERPTVRLPARIPAPRTISHTCTCYKTIVRPRVQQQVITVPTVQRYIQTTHTPVVENIQYEAVPVNCGSGSSSSGAVQVVAVGSGSSSCSSGSVELISSGSSCGSQVQAIEVPTQQVQVVEAPRVQVPQVQTIEVPRVQVVEAPRVQVVETPRVQVVEAPRVQTVQIPQVQTVQIPQTVSVGSSCNCF